MAKLYNFNEAYNLADLLYDVKISENDFEDIALNGWSRIGNKHTRLYKYVSDVDNGQLILPCNVDEIESVNIPFPDAQMTSNSTDLSALNSVWIEGYIDFWKMNEDPYYPYGKYVKYDEGDGVLYFSHDYKNVAVIYHGIIADEETGLPLLNEKELDAVAAYVGYVAVRKEAIRKRDGALIKFSEIIEKDWLRLCNAARVPSYFSQNDMDKILDVKTRWDRKQYGKSFKSII